MNKKRIWLFVIVFMSLICILLLSKKIGNMNNKKLSSEEMLSHAQELLDTDGDDKKIYDLCIAAINEEEENPIGYIFLAYLYSVAGNNQRALTYIEQGQSRMNDNMPKKELARCYFYMGLAYQDMWVFEGDQWNDAAIDCFYQVIDLDEGYEVTGAYYTYNAYSRIIEVCGQRGIHYNTKECIRISEILNEREGGKYSSRLIELAGLYMANGDYEKAKATIETLETEELLTEIGKAWLYARYYCFTGELDKAKEYIDQLGSSDNMNDQADYYLVSAYYEQEKQNPQGVKENIEGLLECNIINLKDGIVQELIKNNDITIDEKYIRQWEKYREQCASISFD